MNEFSNLIASVAIASGLTLALTPAQAEDQSSTHLRYAQVFPEAHYIWVRGGKVFADRVTELTEGQVQFDLFPAAQLGKDHVGLLRSGLADVALLIPSVTADQLPLSSVVELPNDTLDSCEATRKHWSLVREGGIIYDNEYAPQGMHPLFVSVLPMYRILTTQTPLTGIEDLKGLKIRGMGSAMNKTVTALGAVPVQVPAPEIYDALSRGTIDGALWGYLSSPQFGLVGTFGHGIEGLGIGSLAITVAMAQSTWDSLSPDTQTQVMQAANEAQESLCAWTISEDAKVRQDMIEGHGYTAMTLSDAERAKWQSTVNEVAISWAEDMNSTGKPGTEVLDAYRAASGK